MMPGPLDPFTPGEDAAPFAGVEPGMFDKIRGEWGAFLSDPKGRAAMMSAGLALMQPPSFGDNALSQIGRAVGSAGSSAQLSEAQDLKRSELESKDAMREAQAEARLRTAGAAEDRAQNAIGRASMAGEGLKLRQEALAAARERSQLASRLRLSNMYQNEVTRINKENANAVFSNQPQKPIPPFRDWVANNPALRSLGLLDEPGTGTTDDVTDVPAAADTTSRSPQDAQALAWANANPTDPRAIAIKKKLGVQ